jgi:hypothetical protein
MLRYDSTDCNTFSAKILEILRRAPKAAILRDFSLTVFDVARSDEGETSTEYPLPGVAQ